jgi:hypothetical protein
VDVFVATAPAAAVLFCEITSSPGLLIRMTMTMFCTLFWLASAIADAACCVAASSDDASFAGCPLNAPFDVAPASGSPADGSERESDPPAKALPVTASASAATTERAADEAIRRRCRQTRRGFRVVSGVAISRART